MTVVTRAAAGTGSIRQVPPAPERLVWLYVLTGIGLLSLGFYAGYHADTGIPILQWHAQVGFLSCERLYPVPTGGTGSYSWFAGYYECMRPTMRSWTVIAIAWAFSLPVASLVLMVTVPAYDFLRLRRHRWDTTVHPMPDALARFAALCDAHGLVGRRRPALVIAGPRYGQAQTIGYPGRRPAIIVPLAVALRAAQHGGGFDATVSHELAHVRAGDVSWVAAVRGSIWLTVPLLLLVELPDLAASATLGTFPIIAASVVGRGMMLVLLVALLRAGLLRSRERQADAYAAATHRTALESLLRSRATTRPGRPAAVVRALGRPLSRHPAATARLAALTRPQSLPGGFGAAFATTASVVMFMGALAQLLTWVDGAPAPGVGVGDWTIWIGGTLIAAILTPLLLSRTERASGAGSAPRWAMPVLGAGLGSVVGQVLAPSYTGAAVVFPQIAAGVGVGPLLAVASTGAASAVAVAGIACLTPLSPPAGRSRLAKGATHLGAVCVTIGAFTPVPWFLTSYVDDRLTTGNLVMAMQHVPRAIPLSVLPIIAGALLLRRRGHRPGPAAFGVVAVAVVIGGLAAAFLLATHPHTVGIQRVALLQRGTLIIVGASAVVCLALQLTPGPAPFLRGYLGAAVTALCGGSLQYAVSALQGFPRSFTVYLTMYLQAPIALTTLTALALAPLALARRRPAPTAPVSLAVTAALCAILAITIDTPRYSGYETSSDAFAAQPPLTRPAPGQPAPVGHAPLDPAQAQRAAFAVGAVLPAYWRPADPPSRQTYCRPAERPDLPHASSATALYCTARSTMFPQVGSALTVTIANSGPSIRRRALDSARPLPLPAPTTKVSCSPVTTLIGCERVFHIFGCWPRTDRTEHRIDAAHWRVDSRTRVHCLTIWSGVETTTLILTNSRQSAIVTLTAVGEPLDHLLLDRIASLADGVLGITS